MRSGVPMGGQGGHGPRAQALKGAPAQLVGPNGKKRNRPRQISKVTSLQSAVADAGFTKRGGAHPEPQRDQTCRPMLGGGGGGCANSGVGAPTQALAPGRWRPSVRHWVCVCIYVYGCV